MAEQRCDRSNCIGTMTRRIELPYGMTSPVTVSYICDRCVEELTGLKNQWVALGAIMDVGDQIRKFMRSPCGRAVAKGQGIEAIFSDIMTKHLNSL